MRRFTLALVPALVVAAAAGSAAHGAHSLCVGHVPGCFHTIQAAVDAAHDGDTIRIGRGTFAGGVTVEVSVDLIGAGADRTTVAGGGPVLTIGRQDAPDPPTVSIRGVTITGGHNDSQPDTVVVEGGGVWIPHGLGFTTGATVTIADSVITGNSIVPQTTSPFCGDPACAFAFGGGIENEGTLTVENTRVSGNTSGRPGSVTLGAGGGGIVNFSLGTLTMRHSWVTGNRVVVTAPNGQSAESGGLLTAGLATVEDTVVSGNTVEASNVGVEADAFAGGIDVGGSLVLDDSTVDHNRVRASLSSGGFVITDAGGVAVDGTATITDSRIADNSASSTAPGGTVVATGGGMLSTGDVTIRRSLIARNSIDAAAGADDAFVQGGGIANFSRMTLDRTLVLDNRGNGAIASGLVQGGGIWNSNFDGGPPVVAQLTLRDSAIVGNRLTASPGIVPQGGGLYTTFPVVRTRTPIAGNQPDQCFGC